TPKFSPMRLPNSCGLAAPAAFVGRVLVNDERARPTDHPAMTDAAHPDADAVVALAQVHRRHDAGNDAVALRRAFVHEHVVPCPEGIPFKSEHLRSTSRCRVT